MHAKKLILTFVALILLWNLSKMRLEAKDQLDINQLVEDSQLYDQKKVSISGEVIGKPLDRGEYVWLNINDGQNAIGILVPKKEMRAIQYYGSYHEQGDQIMVTGTFQKACKKHGGETDVHGTSIQLLHSGEKISHSVSMSKVMIDILILFVGLGIAFGTHRTMNKKVVLN